MRGYITNPHVSPRVKRQRIDVRGVADGTNGTITVIKAYRENLRSEELPIVVENSEWTSYYSSLNKLMGAVRVTERHQFL